ncbi:TonB-dependent receptor [Aquimarina sp. MMG016]|uniref:TonB-dependent receptor n=1 Tax=Aquimarina sp. MMG016 TaxID=2822690 RepID=UPI001B3A1C5B|nr:TonB-dependent receptor [Aquimarina sp. MMG016]MBQ4819120.1 TonB-dependent receptor [Aquimarina sp. MMG016]
MKKLTLILLSLFTSWCFAQQTVTGTVTDSDGTPLPGVNIIEKGTDNGTTTDFNGKYSIEASPDGTLVFSYVGFASKQVSVNSQATVNVTLSSGAELEEVILVGSRGLPRSNTASSLPIDVLPAKELTSTGQITFDKALQYRIPSFNTVQTPVNDATSTLDPYEIRNMGPSRTLVLVNGKRKNLSALLYTQTSPGRGETGADISAIPTDAIKRVEVLRDGASAQYGSDAIAGVMNIILKNNPEDGSVTLRTGITSEGDGETLAVSLNDGSKLGENGFLNYTVDFSKVNLANRPGNVDAEGEFADFGGARVGERLEDIQSFLARRPDAGNINGSPETTAMKFLVNGGSPISENSEIYFNAAYVYKKVNSFANYRTPYWRDIQDFPYLGNFFPGNNPFTVGTFTDAYGNTFDGNGYDGYVPTFDADLNDYNGTAGFKTKKNGWLYDGSITVGGNRQTYTVRNSHNRNEVFGLNYNPATDAVEPVRLYQEKSQISFDPGGTQFNHIVGNLDIAKAITDQVAVSFGAEFRSENFTIIEGELSSYDGGGADSFAGNRPENSGKFNRYNFGGYVNVSYDITEDIFIDGTARMEDYSDFGEAFVWKVSGRYKFLEDKLNLRASISTGFRAPTLHQIYTQKAQFSFVPGQGIQVGGLINNVSPQARLLEIPQLDAEESTNFTVGFGAKINKDIDFTIDYYNIQVDDRIVLSTEIGPSAAGNTPLDDVLSDNDLSDVSFFVNAIDTKTSGIDVVANYRNIELGPGKLDISLSGNYTIENERDGAVNNPTLVAQAGQSVVNDTQEALFFTSRPEFKGILGLNYGMGKFNFSLNNTLFGPTRFRNQGLQDLESLVGGNAADSDGGSDLGVEFMTKVVTDLGINYNATDNITIALNVNNILNVLPEWEFKALTPTGTAVLNDPAAEKTAFNLITFNGRYSQMSYDGYHFSQLGTMFNLSLNYKF